MPPEALGQIFAQQRAKEFRHTWRSGLLETYWTKMWPRERASGHRDHRGTKFGPTISAEATSGPVAMLCSKKCPDPDTFLGTAVWSVSDVGRRPNGTR